MKAGWGLWCLVVEAACRGPEISHVEMRNSYASDGGAPIYQGFWQAVPFSGPIAPGMTTAPQFTVAASENTAYAVLAPGWNGSSAPPPASLVVLQSRQGFAVDLGQTLQIPVDDTTFIGDCASGSPLTQSQADFITQRIFATTFASVEYDAATCTSTPRGDAGEP
jgi:hypothetical protein